MIKHAPGKIIRALMTVTGQGRVMFNDKTTFGRSIKVWGVNKTFYNEAAKIFDRHGYDTVYIVTTRRGNTRIWVYE